MADTFIHAKIDGVFEADVFQLGTDKPFDGADTTHVVAIKDLGGHIKLFLSLDQLADLANAINNHIFTQGGKYPMEGDDVFKQWEESNA